MKANHIGNKEMLVLALACIPTSHNQTMCIWFGEMQTWINLYRGIYISYYSNE